MKFFRWTVLFLYFSITAVSHACSAVVAGKAATQDGSVLFGHNEDDSGRRVVNAWRVPGVRHEPGEMITLRGGGKVPQVRETYSYFWYQVNGLAYSDYYANEWGVHIASDACASREDQPERKQGGIGYMLRRIVAERAKSAREGVEIAGKLLDEWGYADLGRTYLICDANEGWVLAVVAGKHWVAQRVPDDGAVVVPNQYIIREVDFKDKKNFITSKSNIKDYAVKRGWYDPDSGKPFDFAYAYMRQHSENSQFMQRGYDTRQWYGHYLLTGDKVSTEKARDNGLPFSVKPDRKLAVQDVQAILRSHFEGTQYGPAEKVNAVMPENFQPDGKQGEAVPVFVPVNPNFTSERTFCTLTTVLSTVAQLRSDMPVEIGSLLWVSFGRPDVNVFLPWYYGMTHVPSVYNNTPGIDCPFMALAHHFDEAEGTYDFDADAAFWHLKELENVVDMHYYRAIEEVRPVWKEMEAQLFSMQPDIEKTALRLFSEKPGQAADFLTMYNALLTSKTMEKASVLNNQLKGMLFH